MQLRRSASPSAGDAVLDAVGELDVAAVARLREAIRQGFDEGHARVLVNLAEVSFIDSTAVSSLLHEHQVAAARGRHLGLVAPGDAVTRVLSLLGLGDVLNIHPSVQDAVSRR
ncbi:MAG: anti-sigma factor antagonist [Nocardioidaceae bacterium]|jgi:anti-anti-sigma factor|nr:anti-sigma factor antagonist [Nocardioidaceae bacterium]